MIPTVNYGLAADPNDPNVNANVYGAMLESGSGFTPHRQQPSASSAGGGDKLQIQLSAHYVVYLFYF